jgi:hypothetical protein
VSATARRAHPCNATATSRWAGGGLDRRRGTGAPRIHRGLGEQRRAEQLVLYEADAVRRDAERRRHERPADRAPWGDHLDLDAVAELLQRGRVGGRALPEEDPGRDDEAALVTGFPGRLGLEPRRFGEAVDIGQLEGHAEA